MLGSLHYLSRDKTAIEFGMLYADLDLRTPLMSKDRAVILRPTTKNALSNQKLQ